MSADTLAGSSSDACSNLVSSDPVAASDESHECNNSGDLCHRDGSPRVTELKSLPVDSGNETPDTDKEEEDLRRRKSVSKEKGTKLLHRASFKRDRVDRHYDKLPWLQGAVSRLLGLKVAPISMPWHRRLETFSVTLWMTTFLLLGLSATSIMIYMFLYTQYWWVSLCYLCWYIPDRTICNRGGRRVNWLRELRACRHFRNFFPVEVIKTAELSPDHNYIMCYHPHGILCVGAFTTFAIDGTNWNQTFPGLTPYLLTLEVLFLMPFYRELFLCSGAVSATRQSMDHLLGTEATGRALCLVVGGAPESLDSHPHKLILHLEERKGFAKMALRHGASLVPMFAFGENDVYDQVDNPKGSFVRKVQDFWMKVFVIPPCLFMGRGVFQYSLGIVPFRKPIYVVVGSPLHVDPVKQPTGEQILALHSRYRDALQHLYDTYKHTYARDPSIPMEFV
uniref:Acyltransferase n=1 Tax=Hirondellea gigas TaxID=1518452 RepID=A0A6A7FQS4_9CRUS